MPKPVPETDLATSILDQMLCFEVYQTEHAFGRLYKDLLRPIGLTYPQFLVMVLLWEQDGRTIGDIGRALGLESSTLTPLVKRLEAAGLVQRSRDRQDERRVIVTLSTNGNEMRHQVGHIRDSVIAATGMTEAELKALFGRLRTLRDALSAHG